MTIIFIILFYNNNNTLAQLRDYDGSTGYDVRVARYTLKRPISSSQGFPTGGRIVTTVRIYGRGERRGNKSMMPGIYFKRTSTRSIHKSIHQSPIIIVVLLFVIRSFKQIKKIVDRPNDGSRRFKYSRGRSRRNTSTT
jgi:hypothetical protein